MAANTISPIRFFVALAIGIALTMVIMIGLDYAVRDNISSFNTRLTAGIMFGITIPLALGISPVKPQIVAFLIGSAIIYYLVVTLYVSQIYRGSLVKILVSFMMGGFGELLLFTGLFGFLKQVAWWHIISVLAIAAASPFMLDIEGPYVAIAFWQLGVGSVFYLIARKALKKNKLDI